MITDNEKFIEIQGILSLSDISPNNCIKINNLIIELSKENQELKLELSGYRQAILKDKEMLGLKEENKKYKEVIDKLKELIIDNIEETTYEYIGSNKIKVLQKLIMDNDGVNELLDILKEVE